MRNPLIRPVTPLPILVSLLLLVAAAALPWALQPFQLRVAQQVLLFGGMALAWGLLGGFTNYWSFGHTAFFGIGAFAAGLLEQGIGTALTPSLRLVCGLAFAAAVTLVIAAVIALPVLRLRGIYFAIGMLAFAEIAGEATRNFDVLQGAAGISFPVVSVPGVNRVTLFYWMFLALFVASALAFVLLRRSRAGIGLRCIGQDEDTAAMLGVPTERYKLLAFVLSAVLTGMGGVLYAHSLGFVNAGSVFRVDISLNLILYSMLGGIGTLAGPVIGAAIMIVVTQVVLGNLMNLHLLLTGGILIAIVLAAPNGLMGLGRDLWLRRPRLSRERAA